MYTLKLMLRLGGCDRRRWFFTPPLFFGFRFHVAGAMIRMVHTIHDDHSVFAISNHSRLLHILNLSIYIAVTNEKPRVRRAFRVSYVCNTDYILCKYRRPCRVDSIICIICISSNHCYILYAYFWESQIISIPPPLYDSTQIHPMIF